MESPAKRYQDKLPKIKEQVRRSYEYFKPNYDRYNSFRKFVFDTSLSDDDISLLTSLSRPQLEFNVLEAYISRLLGEFSKQEPDICVNADDPNTADPQIIQIVEQHLRHTMNDHGNTHTKYEVYKDLLSGGFSCLKVCTDYSSPMSMKQDINMVRVFDPTLCGFDHLARETHKGDGRYCFELFPMSEEEFNDIYPDIKTEDLNFRRDFSGFNWSYLADNTKTLIICDYYEKKRKEKRIVQVRDGKVMTVEDYNKMVDEWSDMGTVPPAIVGKPRKTIIEHIVRYRVIENMVLEYEETDFNFLPLVFVDGNSIIIKTPKNGNVRQMTRPYVYHAKGAQRMKNYAGISLANAIENDVQHKFMVAKEALPKEEEYLQAYKDVQKPSVMVYNSVYEGDPSMPINNPIQPVPRIPAPPEITQAFQGTDGLFQMILGSYDSSLGINNNQLSGIAVVESASQSNAAAMPYIVGFLQGFQRAAQIYVDLIPKYWTTPRTIPVTDKDGHKSYIQINQNNQPTFTYDENVLNVEIKAGASFAVQKSRTLMMVKEMMGMSPLFAQFIAEKGLNFVLDNMEGKGVEQLKEMTDSWLQEMQQQKQQAMQMQQQEAQNNPALIRAQTDEQKIALDKEKMALQHQVEMLKLQLEHHKIDSELLMSHNKDMMDIKRAEIDHDHKMGELDLKVSDQTHRHLKDAVDVTHNAHDMHHRHAKEAIETVHMVNQSGKESHGKK